jgi:release factor glutamine methyltransferase
MKKLLNSGPADCKNARRPTKQCFGFNKLPAKYKATPHDRRTLEQIHPIMTIFQAHQTIFRDLLAQTGDLGEARAGARLLTDNISGRQHAHLAHPLGVLPTPQQAQLQTALSELQSGRPLAYILGKREFYNLSFRCDERALIPRPETELLVETALEKLENKNSKFKTRHVADLGTGTGCIAIAIAKNCNDAQIIATDISPAALELARENALAHGVAERVQWLAGKNADWASPLREYSRSEDGSESGFDLIVSNPPYIAPRDIEDLPPQIRVFEPRRALDGGPDGLDCYRQIAAQCETLLDADGVLACEMGAGQFEKVRAIFENQNWRVQKPILDFAGIERVLVAQPKA